MTLNNSKTLTNISKEIFIDKKLYFETGKTRNYKFRIKQLKKLKAVIKSYESEILDALHTDFHKPNFEAFTSEVGFLYEEINYTVKHLKKWMRPKRVSTPIVLEMSKSKIYRDALGVVLIIGPWNYPFQLLLSPLIGAIAGGNCAVLKPSYETPAVANIIEKIIKKCFNSNYISVKQGPGRTIGNKLIADFNWNHIFFTGSPQVGKHVAMAAAEKLCSFTLELGGKSPAIVDKDVNIDKAAKRIVFGKFFNAGQTCVSPDYVLVYSAHKEALIEKLIFYINEFYGSNALKSKHLAHIVNSKRMQVLINYLKQGTIRCGGNYELDKRIIEPTIIDNIKEESTLLTEEIFGPILPIIEWDNEKQLIGIIKKNSHPLACYIFSESRKFQRHIIKQVEFGGGAINNTLVHLVNPKLPFGGIGNSGMGNYHGKHSFNTFTHEKSILKSSTKIDIPLRYPPYTKRKLKGVRLFFK